MKDYIVLTAPKGSVIYKGDGSVVTINAVPDNALELIEQGVTWLMFKKSAAEKLSRLSADRLQKLLKLRQDQKFSHDAEVIQEAISLKEKKKQ